MNNSTRSRAFSPAFSRKVRLALLQKARRKAEARPYRIGGTK